MICNDLYWCELVRVAKEVYRVRGLLSFLMIACEMKTCQECGAPFESLVEDEKFCSKSCRKKGSQVPPREPSTLASLGFVRVGESGTYQCSS